MDSRCTFQLTFWIPALVCLALSACSEQDQNSPGLEPQETPTDPTSAEPGEAAGDSLPPQVVVPRKTLGFELGGAVGDEALKDYHVVLGISINDKDVGELVIDLWHQEAPITTRNFLRLADEGFYDGLTFHRIMRDFMVQGGCPLANGTGKSPYGNLQAEVSDKPARDHRYGVLSMARGGSDINSASCQFFICCDDGPAHWNLDGKYSSFGRVVNGVPTLEAMASVGVSSDGRETSKPRVPVVIRFAKVVRGPPPVGEMPLVRPGMDEASGYKASRVIVQALVVECSVSGKPRSASEARALMSAYQEQIKEGADLMELAALHSDAGGVRDDVRRAVHRILAPGVRDREGDAAMREMQQGLEERLRQAGQQLAAKEIGREEYVKISKGLNSELGEYLTTVRWRPAQEFPQGFLDVAFGLDVGESGLVEYHPALAPRGLTLLKRSE